MYFSIWFNRRQPILTYAFVFIFCDTLFWLKDMNGYAVRKRRTILMAFSDNCGYSLKVHQKFTIDSPLKVSVSV